MFVVLRLAELKKCDCRRVFRWKMRSKRYQNCTRKGVYRTSGSPFCHHLGEASKIFLSDSSGGSVRPHKSLSCFPNCVSYVSREEEEETRGNISYSVNGVYLEGDKLDGVVVITSMRQMANVKSEPRSSSARLGRKLSPN